MTSVYSGYSGAPDATQSQQHQAQPNQNIQAGMGGMPRSRMHQQMDDLLMSPGSYAEPQAPPSRPGSRAGFNRRTSVSSNSSGRGMFGWAKGGKKSSNVVGGAGAFSFSGGEGDDDGEDGTGFDDGVGAKDMMMGELAGLRDRDRYPSVSNGPGSPNPSTGTSNRTMSISSHMSAVGFDTTPIIPTFRGNSASQGNSQYRKNLTNTRKAAFRTSEIPPFTGPQPMMPSGQMSSYPGQPRMPNIPPPAFRQGSFMAPHPQSGPGPVPGPGHRPYGGRLNSMTGTALPSMELSAPGPGPMNPNNRAMSMTTGAPPPGFTGPPMMKGQQQRSSRPPSRLSQQQQFMANGVHQMQMSGPGIGPTPGFGNNVNTNGGSSTPPAVQYKRVSASTMTEPISFISGHTSPSISASTVDLGVQTDDTSMSTASSPYVLPPLSGIQDLDSNANTKSLAPGAAIVDKKLLSEKNQRILDLESMNKSLLDEVRMVTGELADSIRRELGVIHTEGDDETGSRSVSANNGERLIVLEQQLDLERRKRQLAESKINSDIPGGSDELLEGYDVIEMERELAERNRLYQNEQRENDLLRENIGKLNEDFQDLQLETDQLKTGILPELRSHVEDLELLTAAGNPIELLKQIEELKVENKKIQSLMDENSTRGPVGEKIKAVEQQRDVLREALRSLRERKDHEIRQTADRVRQLESKLEKEKVINNQMQRKLVQTRAAQHSPSTATFPISSSKHSSSNSHSSASADLPSPSGEGSADYYESSTASANGSLQKQRSFSGGLQPPAANFAFDDRSRSASPVSFEISQEPTWLDSTDHRYRRNRNTPLSLPKGRTEQLPLSLGSS